MSEEIVSTAPVEPAAPAASTTPDKPEAASDTTPAQNTGDQAPPTTPEGEKPEPTPEQVAKRNQSRLDRKLDKAYRDRAQEKARADLLEQQLRQVSAQQQKPQDAGAPKLEQFEYDPERYAQALADYKTKQAFQEQSARQMQFHQQQQMQQLKAGWDSKVAKAETKYDDFDQVVGDLAPTLPWTRALAIAENGEDVAYYLGKNIKEAHRIVAMSPENQYLAIGYLSAKLQAQEVKPKVPSNAPAPIKPVGGSSSPSTKKLSELDQNEFEKRRKAQIAARR